MTKGKKVIPYLLKRIGKLIRRRLLKIDWIKREVQSYQLVQREKIRHDDWGKTMRDSRTEKSDHRTLATVSDDGIVVDHMDGRMMRQRHVAPVIMDSTQWGWLK